MVLKCLQSLCLGEGTKDGPASWWEEMGHFFSYRSDSGYRPDKEVIQDFIDMFWESHSAKSGAADKLLPGLAGKCLTSRQWRKKMLVEYLVQLEKFSDFAEEIHQVVWWLQFRSVINYRLECLLNLDSNLRLMPFSSWITLKKLFNFLESQIFHLCNEENTNSSNSYHLGLPSGVNKIVLIKCLAHSRHSNVCCYSDKK